MPTSYHDVALLLRRVGFGGKPDEINALTPFDLPTIVDKLLDTTATPALGEPAVVYDTTLNDWDYNRWVTVMQWWFNRMATTPVPIVEKMVLFWQMHFTSSLDKCKWINMWNQQQLFRTGGLGDFKALLKAVAIDPAMLQYLDGDSNVKGKPNENFARECMELFTMGSGNYTQSDVVDAARAWTGHNLATGNTAYQFKADKHDSTNKTIFGVTKNWDGPDVLDAICSGDKLPITARFIAKKLWTFFAYANPSTDLINDLANAFIASNLDIKTLLKAILLRPEFYSPTSYQGRVRNPVEYVVAAMRYTGLPAGTVHPEWYVEGIGMRPMYAPNVAGWKQGAGWISTSTTWSKGNFARNLSWTAATNNLIPNTKTLSVQTAAQRSFDTFGIDNPLATSRAALESAVYNERVAKGYAEQHNLIVLGLLSPEFQLG